jgi:hypothetical protein
VKYWSNFLQKSTGLEWNCGVEYARRSNKTTTRQLIIIYPIIISVLYINNHYNPQMATLGGGVKGIAPRPVSNGTLKGSSELETMRFTLRKAWNGAAASQNLGGRAPAATPFRIVNNAGDYLSREYYTSGGSNQVTSAKQSITSGWRGLAGGVHVNDDGTGIPSATCNTKFVYDGSDYTRFRKQMAVNRNYNDAGFGGANNAAQSAIRAIRRR